MNQCDIEKKKAIPLTFDTKLFVGTHVPDIVVAKHYGHTTDGISSPISKSLSKYMLSGIMEASQALQETITNCTFRKKKLDELIKRMIKEKDDEDA